MYNVRIDLIKAGLTKKYKLFLFTPKHIKLFFFRNYITGIKCKVFSYASECSVVKLFNHTIASNLDIVRFFFKRLIVFDFS